jgi:hypothetical protein
MTKEEKLQILSEGMEINERLSNFADSIGDDIELYRMADAALRPSITKFIEKGVKDMESRSPALAAMFKALSK